MRRAAERAYARVEDHDTADGYRVSYPHQSKAARSGNGATS